MKKLLLLALLLVLAACTSSQFATYRPAGYNGPNWEINVYHNSGMSQNFKVVINDSTVIDESANFFTGSMEERGKYRGKEVKLLVTYSSGFLGFGKKFDAMVFISNELAGKFQF